MIAPEYTYSPAQQSLHNLHTFLDDKHQFDSNEVRLQGYDSTLAELNKRMDQCTRVISEKLQYYETCD
jgi:hypothetical protein